MRKTPKTAEQIAFEKRSAQRRKTMVVHVAKNFKEAEEWDLAFWQSQTPENRVAAGWTIHGSARMNMNKASKKPPAMTLEERSAERRKTIVAHRAANYKEAEEWDLDYWLGRTPQERLEAAWTIHIDVMMVQQGRPTAVASSEISTDDGMDKGSGNLFPKPWIQERITHQMEIPPDSADMLALFEKHDVRYLIIGGLAVIHHSKPRYTKDMDLWVDPEPENVKRANLALAEFKSPYLLEAGKTTQIVQLGVAPNRIDLLQEVEGLRFATAWKKRDRGPYGEVDANWMDIDSLIRAKSRIDDPRHQEDVRVLREVKKRRAKLAKLQ